MLVSVATLRKNLFVATRRRQRRSFAVYAVGEGWTGALGTGRLDQIISGHYDEEEADMPVKIYDGKVHSTAIGWGHTAVVTDDRRLLLTGRPQDFSALLRLKRLPRLMRDYSVRQHIESTLEDNTSLQPAALVGRLVTWLSTIFLSKEQELWEQARLQSILTELKEVNLPASPNHVVCSAGVTAVTCQNGHLYTFGINNFGQCGTGFTSNNVWEPTKVTGLNAGFAEGLRHEMEQTYPITSVALGLQHGICLNEAGEVFCWGKGERGQLGQDERTSESHTALPLLKAFRLEADLKPVYQNIGKILQISSGMIHNAALTDQNQVLVWGKNLLPTLPADKGQKVASDARLPFVLEGLPNKPIVQISCGSHHTSVLFEDGSVYALGISSDTNEPIHEPVELIPPGMLQLPVRQFEAHMDRTTIVDAEGKTVLQVQLFKDEALREFSIFTPAWVERLLDELPKDETISRIQRSWIHSIAVTDKI